MKNIYFVQANNVYGNERRSVYIPYASGCIAAYAFDNEKIKEQFDALRKSVTISREEYDDFFYIVCSLCLEHGRLAFIEGLRLGVVLMQELNIQESRA